MTHPLIIDLARLRPESMVTQNLVLFTLDVGSQTRARHDARRAVDKHGADGEITVYNGRRYRIPAKHALRALTEWRKQYGWKSSGDLWTEAFKLTAVGDRMERTMAEAESVRR